MTDEPQQFSIANAKLAAEEMFGAHSKSKQIQFLGHLNEVLVVLEAVQRKFDLDPNQTVQ